MRFSDRNLSNIKSTGRRIELIDAAHVGLIMRVSEAGRRTFIYRYTINGKRRRMTLGVFPALSLADAIGIYDAARNQVMLGVDPMDVRNDADRGKITVEDLSLLYIELWARPNKRSWREDQRILNKDVIPHLGKLYAADVRRRDVAAFIDALVTDTPALANKCHALLSKMFNFAIEREYITANPLAMLRKPAKYVSRDRVLDDDEIRSHWHGIKGDGMDEAIKLCLLYQLVTAQRKIEVISAQWDDIKGDVWTIPAEIAKNGIAHRVPLSPLALRIIAEARPLQNSAYIFHAERSPTLQPMSATTPDHALRRYLKRLDAQTFTPHDLRRTAATRLASASVPRHTISRILNHLDGSTTAIYDRYGYDAEKRAALQMWSINLTMIIGEALP